MSARDTLASLALALSGLAPGCHVCSINELESEPLAQLVSFVRTGLERGEQCVCIVPEGVERRIHDAFRAGQIAVDEALQSKALMLLTPRQAGFKGDAADPYRMFIFWKNRISQARVEGFSRLRGTVVMECVQGSAAGLDQWLEYEQRLTDLAQTSGSLFLCQYPRAHSTAEHLFNVVRCHPSVIHRGTVSQNLYHVSSSQPGEGGLDASALETLLDDIRSREQLLDVERKRTEEQLRRGEAALRTTQAQLARVSRLMTVGELTVSIAHEVNQPLAAIVAYASAVRRWLRTEPPNIDEADAASAGVMDSARRAREVIARIRSLLGKADSRRETIAINSVMEDVISLVKEELRQHGIRLTTEFGRGLPPILGDRVQLQQVGLNLIMNAVDAMSASTGKLRELVIRTWNTPDELRLAIRDSGVGLPDGDVQTIFEPFYTTKPQGIGIGLSISRSIIEAHNGRLWIERNEGMPGVTAHVALP